MMSPMEQQKSPPTCVPEFNGRGVWFFKENRGDGSIGKAVFKVIAALGAHLIACLSGPSSLSAMPVRDLG